MLLKRKIPIAMISLVSIPLIFLSIIVYMYTSSALTETSKNRIRSISEVEGEQLSSIIYSQKKQLQFMARLGDLTDMLEACQKNKLSKESLKLRREVYKALNVNLLDSPGLENIFAADKWGEIIISADGDRNKPNISNKASFKSALEGKTEISNIVRADTRDEELIVMTTPVRDSADRIIGVLGCEVKLDYFRNKIAAIKMDNQGYVYIVDAKGIIVAHPDSKRIGKLVDNQVINHIVKAFGDENIPYKGEGTYIYQGKEKFMGYCVLKDLNWVVVFTQNKAEMNRPAVIVLGLIILTTLTFVALAVLISMGFTRSITRPITELTETMSKAADGNLNSVCTFQSKNEFGQLAKNFNTMLHQLSANYEELTAVYEELSATEEELRAQYEDLQTNEEHLRRSEERYKLALDGSNDIIWEWDRERRLFSVSSKWGNLTGEKNITEFSLQHFLSLVHSEDVEQVMSSMKRHLEGATEYYKSEFRINTKEGECKWVLTKGKALRNARGELIKMAGSITDISERKSIEDKISYMAYYDALTKLPNRVLFMERLEKMLEKASQRIIGGSVMLIDLDNFKNINDTLGHDYGDRLLELLAVKFKESMGPSDTICRFGGDEFLVLKPYVKEMKEITAFVKRLLSIFEEPFFVNDKLIYITASIGIAVYCQDGKNSSTLLKNADTAMYQAKALGKNRYAFFSREMCQDLVRKIKIEALLREALIKNRFELYYQPQISVKDEKITGFEALLRLRTEEFGFISPGEFIPIAEECGLITDIGAWCLKSACLQNKAWREQGYTFETIAVNISAVQFQQNNFIKMIMKVIKETGIHPEDLEIEITESVLMQSLEKKIEELDKLRTIGVRIALDDFGTGYSSFNYLRKLPIHTLKIDKSFIDGIGSSIKEQAIAHGIIQLAHQMDLEVVAEGVEDEKQLRILQKKECDKVQGYFFSKPLPVSDAEALMKEFGTKGYAEEAL